MAQDSVGDFVQGLLDRPLIKQDVFSASEPLRALENAVAHLRRKIVRGDHRWTLEGAVADWLGLSQGEETTVIVETLKARLPDPPETPEVVNKSGSSIQAAGAELVRIVDTRGDDGAVWQAKLPDVGLVAAKWTPLNMCGMEAAVLSEAKGVTGVVQMIKYSPAVPLEGKDNVLFLEWIDVEEEDKVDAGWRSVTEVKHRARSLLRTLAALAERGIVHGDVCEENVVFEKNGTVRLLDFGLSMCPNAASKVLSGEDGGLGMALTNPIRGRPGTMAPEMLDGSYDPPRQGRSGAREWWEDDPGIDVWSFGATLAEALTSTPEIVIGGLATKVQELDKARSGIMKALRTWIAIHQGGKGPLYKVLSGSGWAEKDVAGALSLMNMCLVEDPKQRPSAQEILENCSWLQE